MYNTPTHKVREFYMNLSPCTNCAPQLLKAYDGDVSPASPVTIYLSRLWTGNNNDYKECLAKLIKKGFKLEVANWTTFTGKYLNDPTCKKEALNYSNNPEFKKQEGVLKKAVEEAEALAKKTSNTIINGWCPENNPNWCD